MGDRPSAVSSDGLALTFHVARTARHCAGAGRAGCLREIRPGDEYASADGAPASAAEARYCVSCAAALTSSSAAPARANAPKDTLVVDDADDLALTTTYTPRRPRGSDGPSGRWAGALRVVVLIAMWLVVAALAGAALYGAMRGVDWLVQLLQKPNGVGHETY